MRYGNILTTRIPPEIMKLLTEVSRNQGVSRSGFVRRAILTELAKLSYLSEEQKKALGLSEEKEND